jgi:hypothetical protein
VDLKEEQTHILSLAPSVAVLDCDVGVEAASARNLLHAVSFPHGHTACQRGHHLIVAHLCGGKTTENTSRRMVSASSSCFEPREIISTPEHGCTAHTLEPDAQLTSTFLTTGKEITSGCVSDRETGNRHA